MPRRKAAATQDSSDEEEDIVEPARGKKKARKSQNSQAASDDGGTQGSAKKGKGAKKAKEKTAPLTSEDIKKYGKQLARYALLNEWKRRPLRRDEATKLILGAGRSRSFPAILAAGSEELASVFGLELVEARPRGQNAGAIAAAEDADENHRDNQGEQGTSGGKKTASSAKSYILRSIFDPETLAQTAEAVDYVDEKGNKKAEDDEDELDEGLEASWVKDDNAALDWKRGDELAQQGVLGIILALILANGRVIDDLQLRAHLKRLHIQPEWKPPATPASHNPPTSIDALLSAFQRQGYLERDRSSGGGGGATQATQSGRRRSSGNADTGESASEWRWGARAEVEIGERGVAELMAEIYLEGDPDAEERRAAAAQAQVQRGRNQTQQIDPAARLIDDIKRSAGSTLQDATQIEGA